MNSKRAVAQLLKHLGSAGVTHLPRVELPRPALAPTPRPALAPTRTKPERSGVNDSLASDAVTSASATTPAAASIGKPGATSAIRELSRPEQVSLKAEDLQRTATTRSQPLPEINEIISRKLSGLQDKTDALCAVAKSVASCKRCSELASRRTQTVFGAGNPDARIMFIGEAPGADEDAQGEPFVGAAGQLLDKIIVASQLKRSELYICNILRCRPPGNRNPLPQEAANCREFLDAQIHIVEPEYIVCWGTVAAQNLLGETRAVGKLRGQFFDYRGIRVLCTYHPSYLLRTPAAKKQVWEDMKFFMHDLGVELQ